MIHVDTHVLVWLYAGERDALGVEAQRVLEQEDVVASPMAVHEMDLLREIGRITASGKQIVDALARQIGLRVSSASFLDVVERATALRWTRDPFDRLIVGNAVVDESGLVTKDKTIRKHFDRAVWDRPPKRRRRG